MEQHNLLQNLLKKHPDSVVINENTIDLKFKGVVTTVIINNFIRLKRFVIDYFDMPDISHREWIKLQQKLNDAALRPFIKHHVIENIDQRLGVFEEKHFLIHDIPLTEDCEVIEDAVIFLNHNLWDIFNSIPRG